MRLTFTALGIELDISLGLASNDEPEQPKYSAEVGTIIGFAPNVAPQWDDQGSLHTLDPGEDDSRR